MQENRGSFLGFTYNNTHSSLFNIVRTEIYSNTPLFSQSKDVTTERPKTSGQYYFGSIPKSRNFTINFAFAGMSEEQLELMQLKWCDKNIHGLVFDEYPYKVYSAKSTNQVTTKYIAYEEGGRRYYNGEGVLNLVCFFPYAQSRFEYREEYTVDNIHEWVNDTEQYVLEYDAKIPVDSLISAARFDYDFTDDEDGTITAKIVTDDDDMDWVLDQRLPLNHEPTSPTNGQCDLGLAQSEYNNYQEWIESSGIPSLMDYGTYNNGKMLVFNAGDVEIPFDIWFVVSRTKDFKISLNDKVVSATGLSPKNAADYYYVLKTSTNSLEGYGADGKQTGSTYNEYLVDVNFFLLPVGESELKIEQATPHRIMMKYWYW